MRGQRGANIFMGTIFAILGLFITFVGFVISKNHLQGSFPIHFIFLPFGLIFVLIGFGLLFSLVKREIKRSRLMSSGQLVLAKVVSYEKTNTSINNERLLVLTAKDRQGTSFTSHPFVSSQYEWGAGDVIAVYVNPAKARDYFVDLDSSVNDNPHWMDGLSEEDKQFLLYDPYASTTYPPVGQDSSLDLLAQTLPAFTEPPSEPELFPGQDPGR